MQRIKPEKDIILDELKKIGVDSYAFNMVDKGLSEVVKLKGLKPGAANILKQEAIASGMDAAVAKGCVNCSVESTDALLLGNRKNIKKLIERLKRQPFGLAKTAERLSSFLNNEPVSLKLRDKTFSLDEPLLMGILNVTPDSFSDGGDFFNETSLKERLSYFKQAGVDIVDIGGESTRPGSEFVSADEEKRRVVPAVEHALDLGLCVSVDTNKSAVAKAVLELGAQMINDISGLGLDEKIGELAGTYDAGLCLMHMKGTPDNMQVNPEYEDLMGEIKDFLEDSATKALQYGVRKESIVLDPGFGFGKTLEDNYVILDRLEEIKAMGYAVLAGISRKSMIGKVVDKEPKDRLAGTIAATSAALYNGADIVRVHDIEETKDMLKIMSQLRKAGKNV